MRTGNDLLKLILEKLEQVYCRIGSTPTVEYDTILLCNPATGGVVVSVISYSPTGVPTTTYYNPDGTIYVGPTPISCSRNLESDAIEICIGGTTPATQWVVKDNGQPTGTVYYTDINGVIIPAPGAFTIGSCPTTTLCNPTISDAFADNLATLLPGHNFVFTKPDCCSVQVVTSAGTFTIREGETYYSTTDFNCLVTVTGVTINSGSCTLNNIHIISNNKG